MHDLNCNERRYSGLIACMCVAQACDMLRDRTAYKDLDRATRKELFDKHMAALRAEAERVKAASAATVIDAVPAAASKPAVEVEEGELLPEEKPKARSGKDRSRSPKSRKKSSSKKSKKHRRDSSASRSCGSDSDSDDSRRHKSKKKKEVKRHRKD